MNLSRRGFLGGIIAAGVAPAIIRTPGLIMPIKPALLDWNAVADEFNAWLQEPVWAGGLLPPGSLYNELTAVTRRAFVPRCFTQIYFASPTLATLLQESKS